MMCLPAYSGASSASPTEQPQLRRSRIRDQHSGARTRSRSFPWVPPMRQATHEHARRPAAQLGRRARGYTARERHSPLPVRRAEAGVPGHRRPDRTHRRPASSRSEGAAVTTGHPPGTFPLTEAVFQAVALKLDHHVGIKRVRRVLRRLISEGVLSPAGSYRQVYRSGKGNSGYRVRLYTLTVAVRAARSKRAVGKRGAVKGTPTTRWWQHPLFGEPDGKPPPHLGRRQAARMRSLDELAWTP